MYNQSQAIEDSKIFIWGQLGEILKTRDKERLLAIIQQDPGYFMAQLANLEVSDIIKELRAKEFKMDENILTLVNALNGNDSLFREVSEMLSESGDMLSTGSAAIGEIDNTKMAIWNLKIKGDKSHDR